LLLNYCRDGILKIPIIEAILETYFVLDTECM
jgi:hypothetical protein